MRVRWVRLRKEWLEIVWTPVFWRWRDCKQLRVGRVRDWNDRSEMWRFSSWVVLERSRDTRLISSMNKLFTLSNLNLPDYNDVILEPTITRF